MDVSSGPGFEKPKFFLSMDWTHLFPHGGQHFPGLVLQLYLWRKQSLSVMIKPRHGLMSPSPIRPSPNMNQRNNLLPKDFFQEPSHFRNRQGHRSPRLRLNAVKLWKEPLPFFRRSDGIPCARMTVKKAWATMAKVMCRCHPVHERTS